MKNFILTNGRAIIDICAWLALIFIGFVGLTVMTKSFGYGLFILIGGLISFFIWFYLIYLFIDIRDTLKEIAEK